MDPINQSGPSVPQADNTVPAMPQENTTSAAPAPSPDQPVVITPSDQPAALNTADASQQPAPASSDAATVVSGTQPPAGNAAPSGPADSVAPLAEPWPGPGAVQDSNPVVPAPMPESGASPDQPAQDSSTPEQTAV